MVPAGAGSSRTVTLFLSLVGYYQRMRWLGLLLLYTLCCNASEVIYLKNGDRVTGSVEKLDAGKLAVKSDIFGEIRLDLGKVCRIDSDEEFSVGSAARWYATTSMQLTDSRAELTLVGSEAVSLPREYLQAINSKEYDPQPVEEPGAFDNWSTAIDAGMSAARGTSSTTNLNFGFSAARVTDRNRLTMGMSSIFARNTTSGENLTSANAVHSYTRYDLNVSDRTFTFALANFDTDQIQNLDLRAVLGGGAGFRLRQGDHTSVDLFSGASFNQEIFSTEPTRRSAELITGQELRLHLNSRAELTQRLMFFPNLTDTGEYRFGFDSGAILKLNSWLGWKTALTNTYVSNPAPGARNNDLLITTGIRVQLGEQKSFKPKLKVPTFAD